MKTLTTLLILCQYLCVVFMGTVAIRHFDAAMIKSRSFMWLGYIVIMVLFWRFFTVNLALGAETATGVGTGIAIHFIGACLAIWLFGFSAGIVAMLSVVSITFIAGVMGIGPTFSSSALTIASTLISSPVADVEISFFTTFTQHFVQPLFFYVVLPAAFLWLWVLICRRLLGNLLNHHLGQSAKDSRLADIFFTVHLPHPNEQAHHSKHHVNTMLPSSMAAPEPTPCNTANLPAYAIRNYFAHFFIVVFAGSGVATLLAMALYAYAQSFEPDALIGMSFLMGYSEAFITGLVYAAFRIFRPDMVYPYRD